MRTNKAWIDTDGKWREGPVIFKFDMSKPETMFIAQAFGVEPSDSVYVTNAPAVEWLRSIEPIAKTMQTVASGAVTARVVNRW